MSEVLNRRILIAGILQIISLIWCRAEAQTLEVMAKSVADQPENMLLGNDFRGACRREGKPKTCIEVFDRLASANQGGESVLYNAALAHIDDVPGHTLLVQAASSKQSIEYVSKILRQRPDDGLSLYIRGLSYVYWPTWYGKLDDAMGDLAACIERGTNPPVGSKSILLAMATLALGDAYVKDGKIGDARNTYRRGLAMNINQKDFTARIEANDSDLKKLVDAERSRDKPIDTNLRLLMVNSGNQAP